MGQKVVLGIMEVVGILEEKEKLERHCMLLLTLLLRLFLVCIVFLMVLINLIQFTNLLFAEKGPTRYEPIVREIYLSKPVDDGIFSPGDDFLVKDVKVQNFGSISCPEV